MIFLNRVPIAWRSRVQCKTSKSIAQAEIYAMSSSLSDAKDVRWPGRLKGIGVSIPKPLVVRVDNDQARVFSTSTCVRSRLKGIFSQAWGWVKELKDLNYISAEYVPARYNAANILTKPIAAAGHRSEMRMIARYWKVA